MTLPGKRVLIIEDDTIIAFDLETELAALGAKVVTAASVEAALNVITSTELDGAAVDSLEGQPPFQVADVLAARHIPFVFTTALVHRDAPARYANVPWLEKPVLPQAVCRALEGVM